MSSGGSPLVLNNAERTAFAHLFAMADPGRTGVVNGDAAVKFFEGFKLPTLTLGQIWSIADSDNNGFLTPNTFGVALRLIARAQRGESVNEASVQIPGAPPSYEGVTLPAPAPETPAGAGDSVSPEDKARFSRIFAMAGPKNGLLSGDQVKDIFVKSKLPYDTLGAIWNLADTKQRGSMDLPDFIIGMHYIQGSMNGTIPSVPATLPPGLYEQAAGGAGLGGAPGMGAGAAPPLQPQATGAAAARGPAPPAPVRSSSLMSPAPTGASAASVAGTPVMAPTATGTSSAGGEPWGVSPADKAKFDGFFDSLDTERTGKIEGQNVVPFFLQSGLDEATLAHVWDLSDITQDGSLSRDEFAVAMRLINNRISGQPLPDKLPANLVPPSLRATDLPEGPNVHQSETQRELFSLIDDDAPAMSPSVAAGAFTGAPGAPGAGGARGARTPGAPSRSATGPPPSSSGNVFEDEFFAPAAGAAAAGAAGAAGAGAASGGESRDLPGDSGAEYGNAQLSLGNTNKALDDLKTRRTDAEAASARNTSALSELKAQLARARSEHETQSGSVRELEERVRAQNSELQSLRQEVIHAESDLSSLKSQKDELEQQLLQDRESVRESKRRLAEVQSETSQLRETLERLGREARHQSGLQSIAQKQLATAQQEQDQVRSGLNEARSASSGASTPTAGSARRFNPFDRFASTPPVPTPPSGMAAGAAGAAAGGAAALGGGAALAAGEEAPARAPAESVSSQGTEGPEEPSALRPPAAEGRGDLPVSDSDSVRDVTVDNHNFVDAEESRPSLSGDKPAEEGTSVPGQFPGAQEEMPGSLPGDFDREAAPAAAATAPTAPAAAAAAPAAAAVPSGANPPTGADPPTGANAKTEAPPSLDDFDSAFQNLGFANVVQHGGNAADGTGARESGFDDAFGQSFAPSGNTYTGGSGSATPAAGGVPPREPPAPAWSAPIGGATEGTRGAAAPISPSTSGGAVPLSGSTLEGLSSPTGRQGVAAPISTSLPYMGAPGGSAGKTSAPPAGTPSAAPPGPEHPPAGVPPSGGPAGVPPSGGPAGVPPSGGPAGVPPSGGPAGAPAQAPKSGPTPPLPEDVGQVRQLCQMGFSRSQVVRALERCHYRTERALEYLLSRGGS